MKQEYAFCVKCDKDDVEQPCAEAWKSGEQCPGCGTHLGPRRRTLSGVETEREKEAKWLKVHLQCKSRKIQKEDRYRTEVGLQPPGIEAYGLPVSSRVLSAEGANACPPVTPPSQSQGTHSDPSPHHLHLPGLLKALAPLILFPF